MSKRLSESKYILAEPGKKHKVKDFDTKYTGDIDPKDAKKVLAENTQQLSVVQDVFYANDRHSVLIIFQAVDAAGKDGTIKHVMTGINPQGCNVTPFKQPSAEELDHDYFWRTYKMLPERGMIGIFNRSYYEEVLVAKVHPEIIVNQKLPDVKSLKDVDEKFWKRRYRQINDIERHLTENGTHIIKFFLNVSKKEQKNRFLERIKDKSKNWKFSTGDIKEREHWDDYMNAFSDMLSNTSTEYAPWFVIPADNKWFMRYAVSKIITEKFEELDLSYPKPDKKVLDSLLEIEQKLSGGDKKQVMKDEDKPKAKLVKKTSTKSARRAIVDKKPTNKTNLKSKSN